MADREQEVALCLACARELRSEVVERGCERRELSGALDRHGIGLALALVMRHATRGRTALRVLVLLPWAIPTAASAARRTTLFPATGVAMNS